MLLSLNAFTFSETIALAMIGLTTSEESNCFSLVILMLPFSNTLDRLLTIFRSVASSSTSVYSEKVDGGKNDCEGTLGDFVLVYGDLGGVR